MTRPESDPTRRTLLAAGAASACAVVLAACARTGAGDGGAAGPEAAGTAATPTDGPRVDGTVAEGLDNPWSIAFLPDDTALVSERDTGVIRSIAAGAGGAGPSGVPPVLGVVPGVVHGGEGGLLGLVASPDFATDRLLYAYFTAGDGNRVSRFELGPQGLGAEQPVLTRIPSAGNHNGGRIKFGPDGMLYVGTGDAANRDASQDPDSPAGKILRLDPADEGVTLPVEASGGLAYTSGHRNVQGLAWDADGRMWATEFGPDRDDELNLVEPGANYGWPAVTGAEGEGFTPAVHVWPSTADASPSALAIVEGVAYAACLRGQRLWRLPLPEPGRETEAGGTLPGAAEFLRGGYGRLRDVVVAPRGAAAGDRPELWVATNEGGASRILRVTLAEGG